MISNLLPIQTGDFAKLHLYYQEKARTAYNEANAIGFNNTGYWSVINRADAYSHAAEMLAIVANIEDYTLDTPDADLSETEAESRPIFIHAMEQAPQDNYMVMIAEALNLKPAKK